jgi:hypothetical protein
MGAANATSYDALLRELWPQDDIYDELYDINETFFGVVSKDTSFYEKIRHIAVGYGFTQGLGASFSAAKANRAGSVQAEWKITPVTYYSMFSIQRQLLRRAKNKKAAILPALERETRMAIEGWKRMAGIYLWNKSGVGDLGKVSAISTNTITLTNANDIKHFEQNMTVEFSVDNTGSAGVRNSTQPLIVTQVDREGLVITFNVNVTVAIPTAATNDFVYRASDYNAVVSSVYSWVPTAAPGSTPFFGLNRAKDPQRLGGWRVSCTGLSPRAAAKKTAKVLKENGGKPNYYFLSPNDFLNLQMELESTGALKNVKEPGASIGKYSFGIPFEGISMMGPAGEIKCFLDINTQDNYPVMTQLNTWEFGSMGDVPYFDMEDGNRILRESDADAYAGQIIGDFQLYNEAPGKSAVALLLGS